MSTWEPMYESWRHGGWYVTNLAYPSGAIGCVSRNYADKKWRVVCADHETTYASRDAAAHAEREIALAEFAKIRAGYDYKLYREVVAALPVPMVQKLGTYVHVDRALRAAARDSLSVGTLREVMA